MKTSFMLFILAIIFANFKGQSQPIGFVQSECGIISNPSYHYTNYQWGIDGAGTTLYHYNKLIAEFKENYDAGYSGMELKFVNDTTGFFVVLQTVGTLYAHKIINDSVIQLGVEWGGRAFNSFVLNQHDIFLASYYPHPVLSIVSMSDMHPQTNLVVQWNTFYGMTVVDTAEGTPICLGLNELTYKYKESTDTLIYKIKLNLDSLNSIKMQSVVDFIIFPNPAKDFICVKPFQNERHYSITILDNIGLTRKSIMIDDPAYQNIYIGDLEKGFYFVIFKNTKAQFASKLIKI